MEGVGQPGWMFLDGMVWSTRTWTRLDLEREVDLQCSSARDVRSGYTWDYKATIRKAIRWNLARL